MSELPDPATITPHVVWQPEHFCEGPVVDRDGALFISSPPGGYVLKGSDGGDFVPWAEAPRCNGHKILPNGEHILCHGDHMLRLDADGNILDAAAEGFVEGEDGAPGHQIRWPNDVTLDHDGGFYFTESIRQEGAVIHVDADGHMRIVARDIDFANGLALTADGSQLLVAESYRNRIVTVGLDGPGVAAGSPQLFAELPEHDDGETLVVPDGIALDAQGRLWVAHYGMRSVHVLSTSGELLATYDAGMLATSNLCFAGGSVYVTGGIAAPGAGLLTRLDVGVDGA